MALYEILEDGTIRKVAGNVRTSEYPVGSYHICATGSENPAIKFGGTWTQVASNVVLPLGNIAPVGGMDTNMSLSSAFNGKGISWTGQVSSGREILVRTGDTYTYLFADLAGATNALSVDVWLRES